MQDQTIASTVDGRIVAYLVDERVDTLRRDGLCELQQHEGTHLDSGERRRRLLLFILLRGQKGGLLIDVCGIVHGSHLGRGRGEEGKGGGEQKLGGTLCFP